MLCESLTETRIFHGRAFPIRNFTCARTAGTRVSHCSPLGSFARLALPIMRDNAGNRLSRFRSRPADHYAFQEARLSQMRLTNGRRIHKVPREFCRPSLLMPLRRTKEISRRGYLDSCGMHQRQIVRKPGFLFSREPYRYECICFCTKKRDGKPAGTRCFLSFT